MKKKVIRLNEQDIENLVKKIIKEDLDENQKWDLADIHDDVLYLTPEWGGGSVGKAVEVFERIMDIVSVGEMSDEAKSLVKRIEYDLGGLDGVGGKVMRLYNTLTGDSLS